jgi:hypothetical protein
VSLDIFRSHTSDPRPWLEPDGSRHRTWQWHDRALGAGQVRGAYAYRDAETIPHTHPGNPVLQWARERWDEGDPFGSAMLALGGIADLLATSGLYNTVPQGWGYSPGAAGPFLDAEGEDLAELLGLLEAGELAEPSVQQVRELLHAGAVLDRLITHCRLTGRDY